MTAERLTLSRALPSEPVVSGNIVEGIAYLYDHPSDVTDDGVNYYPEAFAWGCDRKTLRDRSVFPMGWHHPWSRKDDTKPLALPLGAVEFHPSEMEGALIFTATVASHREAQERLELARMGAASDVSVSFRPHQDRTVLIGGRRVLQRVTIAIRELSLAPSGLGQHEGSGILAFRAEGVAPQSTPRLDLARRRLLEL